MLLCTWLIEIYLNQINLLEEKVETSKSALDFRNNSNNSNHFSINEYAESHREVSEEFKRFLNTYKVSLIVSKF
jgi:hypothetical protein